MAAVFLHRFRTLVIAAMASGHGAAGSAAALWRERQGIVTDGVG